MSHSVTCKLNKDARQHTGQSGTTFFVSLGEKNYNFKTKENEWTNYEAALFAKDKQIQFYTDTLVEGSVIEVSGTGIIIEPPSDPQYSHRLQIQEAKLGFVHSSGQSSGAAAPQPQAAPQQAPPKPMAQQPAPMPAAPQAVDHTAIIGQ